MKVRLVTTLHYSFSYYIRFTCVCNGLASPVQYTKMLKDISG